MRSAHLTLLRCSLFQSKGLAVGTIYPTLAQGLSGPTNLFGRHFAILGQTGSGNRGPWLLSYEDGLGDAQGPHHHS
jgi:hypothetical protein